MNSIFQYARRLYVAASIIVLNSILCLIAANLVLMAALYLWHLHTYQDPFVELTGFTRIDATHAYPGWKMADIDDLLRETYKRPYQYEPYTQFAEKEFHGKYINISPAGFRIGKRRLPWPPDPSSFNIFVFGGSTTFGWGVSDAETIVEQLQDQLSPCSDGHVAVYNFGRDSYFSTQELMLFYRLISSGHIPKLVLFLDGLNDFTFWKGEPDYTDELRRIMNPDTDRRAAALRQIIGGTPMGIVAKRIRRGGTTQMKAPIKPESQILREAIFRWRANQTMIKALAAAFHVQCVFIWQPIPLYRYDLALHFLSGRRQLFQWGENAKSGYPIMEGEIRSDLERNGDFLWLADLQENMHENLYVDAFHYNPPFCRNISIHVANFLRERGVVTCSTASRADRVDGRGHANFNHR